MSMIMTGTPEMMMTVMMMIMKCTLLRVVSRADAVG